VLNVLPEGLIGPLPVVAEILGVPWVGVGALEVANEDRMEITPIADAARLELLDPSSGRAQQKQRKVLDSEVIV
jgi:hypothetical protein